MKYKPNNIGTETAKSRMTTKSNNIKFETESIRKVMNTDIISHKADKNSHKFSSLIGVDSMASKNERININK